MTRALVLADNLELPLDMVTETLALIANRGAGKSTTAVRLTEELHGADQTVVVLDPKGDWHGIRHNAAGTGPGLPFVIFGGDHADVPLEPTAGRLLAQVIVEHRLSCVLDLSAMSKTQARQFTLEFAEELYRRNRDPIMVIVDEADLLVPQRASADVARLLGAMEDLAKRGRHRGIGVTFITQRGADVSKTVLDLVETLIVMRVTGPRTRAAIMGWIDDHTDDPDQMREVLGSLKSLEVGEAWVWSPGFLRLLRRIRVLPIRTFDSHATPRAGERRRAPKRAAPVDLDALGERIKATMERAKADDPRELRRQIGVLERRLAQRPEAEVRVERVEVPILDADLVDQLKQLLDDYRKVGEDIGVVTGRVESSLAVRDSEIVRGALAEVRATPLSPSSWIGRSARGEVRPDPVAAPAAPELDGPPLKAGARRILETMARHHPVRMTRAQVATLAGFKVSGGTFQSYWSALKTNGLIVEDGRLAAVTEAGLAEAGEVLREPMTPEEVLAVWRGALKAGARRMLDLLVEVYPTGIDRSDLGRLLEMAPAGGTFQSYLSTLRTNGLAVVDGPMVTASPTLFDLARSA
jgi:uncharacterized protein